MGRFLKRTLLIAAIVSVVLIVLIIFPDLAVWLPQQFR